MPRILRRKERPTRQGLPGRARWYMLWGCTSGDDAFDHRGERSAVLWFHIVDPTCIDVQHFASVGNVELLGELRTCAEIDLIAVLGLVGVHRVDPYAAFGAHECWGCCRVAIGGWRRLRLYHNGGCRRWCILISMQ
jgi:hypothetical protein